LICFVCLWAKSSNDILLCKSGTIFWLVLFYWVSHVFCGTYVNWIEATNFSLSLSLPHGQQKFIYRMLFPIFVRCFNLNFKCWLLLKFWIYVTGFSRFYCNPLLFFIYLVLIIQSMDLVLVLGPLSVSSWVNNWC
jgi:hypothetical protein